MRQLAQCALINQPIFFVGFPFVIGWKRRRKLRPQLLLQSFERTDENIAIGDAINATRHDIVHRVAEELKFSAAFDGRFLSAAGKRPEQNSCKQQSERALSCRAESRHISLSDVPALEEINEIPRLRSE